MSKENQVRAREVFTLATFASHSFVSVTVLRASSCSRHQNGSLHNTSLFAVTVRPTLIIYLLQFRLFFEYFSHFLPPCTHPIYPVERPQKKRTCVYQAFGVVVTIITGYTESNIARSTVSQSSRRVHTETKDGRHSKI